MYYQKIETRKKGIAFTYFGRPRNLQMYYNTSDPKKVSFADRSAVNTVVQGCGADVLRKKYCELDTLLKTDKEFSDNVILSFSVYDEINFYVKFDYIETAYHRIVDIMKEQQPDWVVPLVVEGSVGLNWGRPDSKPSV